MSLVIRSGALLAAATLFIASSSFAAPAKAPAKTTKPAVKAPRKLPAKTSAKAPAKPSTGLGQMPLPGDSGKLNVTYALGSPGSQMNFTLKSAEYSVVPVSIGDNTWVPKGDEKLLILHFEAHNPLKDEQQLYFGSFTFTAVDPLSVNHQYVQAIAREGTSEALNMNLKPAQKVDVWTVIPVPAKGVIPKLIVQRESETGVVRYDLRNSVSKLSTPYVDTSDASGATALGQAKVPANSFAPIGVFSARLDAAAYKEGVQAENEPEEGMRWVSATFTIRNDSSIPTDYSWSYFHGTVIDADGEKTNSLQLLLKAARDADANGELKPGEEARVRFLIPVPTSVEAKTLLLTESKSVGEDEARVFEFDLTGLLK